MKAFCYSYVTRTAAFLLAVLCAVVGGVSALLTVAGARQDVYEDPDRCYRRLYDDAATEAAHAFAEAVADYYHSGAGDPFDPAEVCETYPNVAFLVTDQTGAVFYETEVYANRLSEQKTLFSALVRREISMTFSVSTDPDAQEPTQLTLRAGVRRTLITGDRLERDLRLLDLMVALCRVAPWLCLPCLIAGVACAVLLCCAAGHQRTDPALHLTWIDRVPLDLTALIVAFFTVPSVMVLAQCAPDAVDLRDWPWPWIAVALALGTGAAVCLWLLVTLAARVTVGGWWRNNVIVYCAKGVWRLVRWVGKGIAAALRAAPAFLLLWLGFVLLCACEAVLWPTSRGVAFWLFEKAGLAVLLALLTVWFQRLRRGAHDLAEGHLDARVDVAGMPPLLREHGERLNSLSEGLTQAVEERTRSERMKAELITNVSHDLKTPLTSLVNYVDLLKKEPIDNERAREYLDILDRQSQRMKKLITDLVDASKASTGNLPVSPEPVAVELLLTQLTGEYRDRMTAAMLELVCEAEPDCHAMADVRLLGRVFDNLLGNALKYAMPGTRVYLTARRAGESVAVSLKNVSRERLTVSGEELTERFVRGDLSRSTEGSGLGLSIAKNLIELQRGRFAVTADGDLFKVEFTLPAFPG